MGIRQTERQFSPVLPMSVLEYFRSRVEPWLFDPFINFYLLCVYGSFACLHVCGPRECLVPLEVTGGCQIP